MNKLDYRFKAYQFLAEDGWTWMIEYPDIPACVGGGDTLEEAIKEGKENIEAYFKYLEEKGEPKPEPTIEPKNTDYSGKLVLRLSKGAHKKISELATEEGVSINALLNELVSEGIERRINKKAVKQMVNEIKEDYIKDNTFIGKLVHQ